MPQDDEKKRRAQALLDAAGFGDKPVTDEAKTARANELLVAGGFGPPGAAQPTPPAAPPIPQAPEPTFGEEAAGVARDLNIGVATSLGLPVDIVTSVLNAANFLAQAPFKRPSAIEPALDPRGAIGGSAQLTETMRQLQGPQTETGQFVGRAAEFFGGSALPLGTIAGLPGRAGQAIRQAPGRALGAEAVASGLAAGGGELAAGVIGEEARPFGELAGAVSPIAAQAATRGILSREQRRLADPERLRRAAAEEQEAFRAEQALGGEDILLPAQRVGEPFLLESQSFLAQLPESSKIAAVALKKQNKQAFNLVNRVINDIAPAEVVGTAGARFKTASAKAIELQKVARENKASPIFKDAFSIARAEKTRVDISSVIDEFNSLAGTFVPESAVGKTIESVRKTIEASANRGLKTIKGKVTNVVTDSNLLPLHGAKTDLDREIAKAVANNDGQTLRPLMRIKENLVTSMTDSSKAYFRAERAFEDASPQVNEIINSVVGRAAKVEGKEHLIARDVFAPGTQNPATIQKTQKIIEGVDRKAWRNIVRAEIENRLGAAVEKIDETGALAIENIPSQLNRSLFGTAKSRSNLLSAMDKKSRENFIFLEKILKRASLGRPGGSQTGIRNEISKKLRSIFGKIRLIAQPLEAISGRGTELAQDAIVREQAKLFFDPNGFNSRMGRLKGSTTDPRVIVRTLSAFDDSMVPEIPEVPEVPTEKKQ